MKALLNNLICLALLVLLVNGCSRSKDGGQASSLTYKITQVQKFSLGKEQNENRYTTVLAINQQVAPSQAALGIVFKDMAVSINSNGNLLQYDSRTKAGNSDQFAQAVQELLGKQIKAVVPAAGRTLSMEDYDRIQNSRAATLFGAVLGRQRFEHSLRTLFLNWRYTWQPPAIGDSWTDTDEAPVDDQNVLVVELTYRVDAVDEAGAMIGISGTSKVLNAATRQELPDFAPVEQAVQGTISWSREKNAVSLLDARYTVVLQREDLEDTQLVVEYMNVAELVSQ